MEIRPHPDSYPKEPREIEVARRSSRAFKSRRVIGAILALFFILIFIAIELGYVASKWIHIDFTIGQQLLFVSGILVLIAFVLIVVYAAGASVLKAIYA